MLPGLEATGRIALWARANGFGLNDGRVLQWAKCSRSVLYDTHRKAVENVCDDIKKLFPDEVASTQLDMARMVLEHLGELIAVNIFQNQNYCL